MAEMTFSGRCSHCKAIITVELVVVDSGEHAVSPPPVVGTYHECGSRDAPGGLTTQAVPLTLRGDPA